MKTKKLIRRSLLQFLLTCVTGYVFSFSVHAQMLITTIAGNGSGTYSGDGGPATAAGVDQPQGSGIDNNGNIYFGGIGNRIRRVDTNGIITTIAGNGYPHDTGDGGPATAAAVLFQGFMAADGIGNLYIAAFCRIRKIDIAGIITPFAGTGFAGPSSYPCPATAAAFAGDLTVSLDTAGNAYIDQMDTGVVFKVNSSGIISVIAGNFTHGFSGDSGPATAAQLYVPVGAVFDRAGNMYVSDCNNFRIRKVNNAGIITTIAGNGISGDIGDGGPATAAEVSQVEGICVDSFGNIYFTETIGARIRKIDTSGIITTLAGNGTWGYAGDNGPATASELNVPGGINIGRNGNIFFCDRHNNRVRMIYSNHAPYFMGGHITDVGNRVLDITTCIDIAISLDSLLAIRDIDLRQPETWSIITGPSHGTAVVAHIDTSTGHTLVPTGLSYTPIAGYIGSDSFYVRITDGYASDSMAVTINVVDCHLGIPVATGKGSDYISIFPSPNNGAFTINLSSNIIEDAHIIISNILGEIVKEFNIPSNKPAEIELHIPQGMYFISATTEHGKWSKQFLIAQ